MIIQLKKSITTAKNKLLVITSDPYLFAASLRIRWGAVICDATPSPETNRQSKLQIELYFLIALVNWNFSRGSNLEKSTICEVHESLPALIQPLNA